jgi:hypothetical protein
MADGNTSYFYSEEIRQIILDPQISIPASEIWLFNNPDSFEAVAAGLKEISEGKIARIKPDEL